MTDDAVRSVTTITGVERAIDVLTLFVRSDASSLGVTEIARSLGLSKAVVHRILASFRARGFVELEESTRRYVLGPEILYLGVAYLDRLDVRQIAREAMVRLVQLTNETATLSVRVGWNRVYLDQLTPDRDVKMVVQLGRPFPLHAGASSKTLLAFLPSAEQDEYIDHHDKVAATDDTIVDPIRLRHETERIRQIGFAVSFGEREPGAGSVAAPVFRHDGEVAAVISVAGPSERIRANVDGIARELLQVTDAVSRNLGYRPPPRDESLLTPPSSSAVEAPKKARKRA